MFGMLIFWPNVQPFHLKMSVNQEWYIPVACLMWATLWINKC